MKRSFGDASHAVQLRTVALDRPLYQSYLNQYEAGRAFCRALHEVLQSEDHRRIMNDGKALGYDMPDEDELRRRLALYQKFLRRCAPGGEEVRASGRVDVPVKVAKAWQHLPSYNRGMTEYVYNAVTRTQYFLRFSELRRTGRPYMGPVALQEMVDVMLAVMKTDHIMRRGAARRFDI